MCRRCRELRNTHLLLPCRLHRGCNDLQFNVPRRAMFECGTVEELAEYVRGLQGTALDEGKVERLSDLMAELEGL